MLTCLYFAFEQIMNPETRDHTIEMEINIEIYLKMRVQEKNA